MAHIRPYLLSTSILVLPFATLLIPTEPSGSVLAASPATPYEARGAPPGASSSRREPLAAGEDGLAPVSLPAAMNAEGRLAARVGAALAGTSGSRAGSKARRRGRAGSPGGEVRESSPAPPRADWICGRWEELWQGSGRGRECEWVPRP